MFPALGLHTGPWKEKQLNPGTIYPVLGNLLFFLPQRYKEKLCCVTPLENKVRSPYKQNMFNLVKPPSSSVLFETLLPSLWTVVCIYASV